MSDTRIPATMHDPKDLNLAGWPAGWEKGDEQQGGQPNGRGKIEPSDSREWFTPERETHHRRVITLTGPWEDGPTDTALAQQVSAKESRAAERTRLEENTLRDARAILARRAALTGE